MLDSLAQAKHCYSLVRIDAKSASWATEKSVIADQVDAQLEAAYA